MPDREAVLSRVTSVSGPTWRTWRGDIMVTVRLACGHEYTTMDVVAPSVGASRRCRECAAKEA